MRLYERMIRAKSVNGVLMGENVSEKREGNDGQSIRQLSL